MKISKARVIKAIKYLKNGKIKELMHQMNSARILDGMLQDYEPSSILDEIELRREKDTHFSYEPLISIVVPVFNPKESFIGDLLLSVISQTYSNWELCLANAGDSQKIKDILIENAAKESRIKIQELTENAGISENSNAAITMANGEYISLLDHDDLLSPNALYEVVKSINEQHSDFIYSDEDKMDYTGKKFYAPYFKPNWSPYLFLSNNYICHFSTFKRSLLDKLENGFLSGFDGAQDYELFLRLTEQAKVITHIPKVLYHWRVHEKSTAAGIGAKSYAVLAGERALNACIARRKINATVESIDEQTLYRFSFKLDETPKISILILNYNELETIRKCISSIIEKSTYSNFEIIIIENNSTDKEVFAYYNYIQEKYAYIKVIDYGESEEFNYSALNNFGRKYATGEFLVLLNNDTEVITPDWLEKMLAYAQREDVGCVGCKLLYPDNTIQHAGVVLGLGSVAGHPYQGLPRYYRGYSSNLLVTRNVSAVTGACLMVRTAYYDQVGGLDEEFAVAFNDVDFCLKLLELCKNNLLVPYVELYHYESKSRGADDSFKKQKTLGKENAMFLKRWAKYMNDPFYNPNLSRELPGYGVKK